MGSAESCVGCFCYCSFLLPLFIRHLWHLCQWYTTTTTPGMGQFAFGIIVFFLKPFPDAFASINPTEFHKSR